MDISINRYLPMLLQQMTERFIIQRRRLAMQACFSPGPPCSYGLAVCMHVLVPSGKVLQNWDFIAVHWPKQSQLLLYSYPRMLELCLIRLAPTNDQGTFNCCALQAGRQTAHCFMAARHMQEHSSLKAGCWMRPAPYLLLMQHGQLFKES